MVIFKSKGKIEIDILIKLFYDIPYLTESAKRSEACNFIKKVTLAQVFSCELCEISKNTFFTEHLWWLLLNILIQNQFFQLLNSFWMNR